MVIINPFRFVLPLGVDHVCRSNSLRLLSSRSALGFHSLTKLPHPSRGLLAAQNIVQDTKKRTSRRRGFLLSASVLSLGIYIYDWQYKYSTLIRNLRAVSTFAVVAVDSKIQRLRGEHGDEKLLRERSAERFVKMFQANGGIYQKIGQSIALQSTTMSPEIRAKFAIFYDECPSVSLTEIAGVLREDFDLPNTNSSPEAVFDSLFVPGSFESKPIGSASVAQVHRARLKDTGEEVAVKIQKPAIAQQISWDLWVFATLTSFFARQIPSSFRTSLTDFFTDRIILETDFLNEVSNAEHMREVILNEPRLRDVVHIPKTYPALCTKRVMVAEWIRGTSISQSEVLTGPWKDNEAIGTPYTAKCSSEGAKAPMVYGLGLQEERIMSVMLDLFCAQTFMFGEVHCDPHPGNILIRRLPNGKPQLVLLDHGLYVSINPKLRHEIALFWRSLLTFDKTTLLQIAEAWGFGNIEILSKSLTLESIRHARKNLTDAAEKSEKNEEEPRIADSDSSPTQFGKLPTHDVDPADFFADADKIPKELIFIARNFRIVQGNNRLLGSPVDRLKVIGRWAQASLQRDEDGSRERGVWDSTKRAWAEGVFKVALWGWGFVGWIGGLSGLERGERRESGRGSASV